MMKSMEKEHHTLPLKDTESSVDQKIRHYIKAGTSENTRQAYRADVQHFQNWGGLLPCSREKICEYLVDHAQLLSVSTLNRRLAGLSSWHNQQGFADPTDTPVVRKVMQGIRRKHNAPPKKARPITLKDLTAVVSYLDRENDGSVRDGLITADLEKRWLISHRDKALLLIGFWRGFRADTLCDLRLEFINPICLNVNGFEVPGLDIYLPKSKGDRQARGESFTVPAMEGSPLCPVRAYKAWLQAAGIENSKGFVFRKFDRRGQLTEDSISPGSLANWTKRLCKNAGLTHADEFSSHSLRRGLATLMKQNGADVRMLMDHIGWKSASTAMSYVDSNSESTSLLLSISN